MYSFSTAAVAVASFEMVRGVAYQRTPLTVAVFPPVTVIPTVWLTKMTLVRATVLGE